MYDYIKGKFGYEKEYEDEKSEIYKDIVKLEYMALYRSRSLKFKFSFFDCRKLEYNIIFKQKIQQKIQKILALILINDLVLDSYIDENNHW